MKLAKRQLILILLTVLALMFLAWQIFRLINDDLRAQDRADHAIAQVKQSEAALHQQRANEQQVVAHNSNTHDATPSSVKPNPYVKLVDEYQYLQMERKLLNEKLAIEKLKAEIAKLDTQDTNMTAHLVNDASSSAPHSQAYRLVYLAQQDHQWSATLAKGNQYQTVVKGDKLADGSKVVAIAQSGVTLQNSDSEYIVDLNQTKIIKQHQAKKTTVTQPSNPNPPKTQTASNPTPSKVSTFAKLEQHQFATEQGHDQSLSLDEVLLLEKPADHYTIELASAKQSEKLNELVTHFNLSNQAMQYHTQHGHEILHTLLLGDFTTREKAQMALTALPIALRKMSPQVVSLGNIQQSLKHV